MEKKQHDNPRLYEFRIKYNVGANNSAMNSYHYYMAETGEAAYSYHTDTMNRRHVTGQNLSIERYNPWSKRWEDASEALVKELMGDENRIS